MRLVTLRSLLFAASVVLTVIPALLIAGQPTPIQTEPSPAERVRAKLDEAVTFRTRNTWTLADALNYLADRYDLTFDVDERAFAELKGNPLQSPICSFERKDSNLKVVLWKLLRETHSNATYVIVGKRIVITTDERAPYQWMRQTVDVECDKEELSSVLKQLAHETGTRLAIDTRAAKEAHTPVTLDVHEVTLETAMCLLADAAGLKPLRRGNELILTTPAAAKEMRSDPERGHLIGPCPLLPEGKHSPLP